MVIKLTVRDLAAGCPVRKIMSAKRERADMLHISGQKTGKELEDEITNLVTTSNKFDAVTQYDLSFSKRMGGTTFKITGKLDLLIRDKSTNPITPVIVEIKYDPLTPPNELYKIEHARQVSIYAAILEQTHKNLNTPIAYLQYWRAQTPSFIKFVVLYNNYPEVDVPFVETFKFMKKGDARNPGWDYYYKDSLFELAKAVAWKNEMDSTAPVDEMECRMCPYKHACTAMRRPDYMKLYNVITYDKFLKYHDDVSKYLDTVSKEDRDDLRNYVAKTIKFFTTATKL